MKDNDKDLNSKYRMLKVIGIGDFGVVFTAVNKKTNKIVAIKKVINKFLIYTLFRLEKSLKMIFHMPKKY